MAREDDADENSLARTLGAVVVSIPLSVVTALVRGWAVAKLWGWFVVPVFGLPLLSYAAAFGLALLTGLLTHQIQTAKEDERYKGAFNRTFIVSTASVILSVVTVVTGKLVVLWWL
ncbi:MAG: hypothetical protein EPN91_08195 [Salinibacterium sp.]|nr:MAG: hypothetical protein EPN91_08195 [Salinibacterium sp.]